METPKKSCPFCAILRGEDSSARVICQGPTWAAFFPLRPAALGHTLVIPREHVTDLWSSSAAINDNLVQAVTEVGQAIRAALKPDGLNLITSAGEAAEQSIPHLHLHLVPRWTGDPFGPIWSEGSPPAESELEAAAFKIRRECRGS
jgi:histidine triad (HIT) family protein